MPGAVAARRSSSMFRLCGAQALNSASASTALPFLAALASANRRAVGGVVLLILKLPRAEIGNWRVWGGR